ncbi:ATP-binding protein [Catenovulum maritimum]|uniref:Histidine kinase domain-containing protein n=1 Tax=Catenovulum maritimum TaxID=1513271 RepID=A0A0J8JNM4_9ALTE|nr:ATP-binding protein [Catenovulum maritimum]KMT66221.1 hypothetical protein XM47_04275 [Catenovulum maritimum]
MKPLNIPGWLIILICVGLSLAGSYQTYQTVHKFEEKNWISAAKPEVETFTQQVKQALDARVSLLQAFVTYASVIAEPSELESLVVSTVLQNQAYSEASLGHFKIEDNRLAHIWSYGTARIYHLDESLRYQLLSLFQKSKTNLGQLTLSQAGSDGEMQDYMLAGITRLNDQGSFDFFFTRIDLSLIQVGLSRFSQPNNLWFDIHLMENQSSLLNWQFGANQVSTPDISFEASYYDYLWQFNIKLSRVYKMGPNHAKSLRVIMSSVIISLLIALLFSLITWHRYYSVKQLKQVSDDFAETSEELASARANFKKTARFSILSEITPGLSSEVAPMVSQSIKATSSLEERALNFKVKMTEGKVTKSNVNTFIDNTIQLSNIAAANVLKAGELAYNLNQISRDLADDKKRKVNLSIHVDEVISALKTLNKNKKINYIVTVPQDLEIATFSGSLTQILVLAISNSLEHGFKAKSEGTVMVEAFKGKEAGSVTLRVEDNGNGIEAELLEAISQSLPHPKLIGVGLSLMNEVVTEKLKGSVKLESRQGKYTRLTFNLGSLDNKEKAKKEDKTKNESKSAEPSSKAD